jgi:nitroreductase
VPETLPQTEESLFEVLHTMRAMRRLKPDPVPRELLEQIVDAATRAPTGGNSQTYHYLVADDPSLIAQIAPLWRRAVDIYGTQAEGNPPPTTSPEQWDRLIASARFAADHFEEVPALIVACLDMAKVRRDSLPAVPLWAKGVAGAGFPHSANATRNLKRFVDRSMAASILPGAENALIAARALGLGATLTTWHLLFEQEFKRILGIPRSVQTWAVIPVGYPRGRFGPVSRRPLEESLHWNRW